MVLKEGMNQWLLAARSGSAAKEPSKDLKIVGPGPVYCHFSLDPIALFPNMHMCSSQHAFRLHNHGTYTIAISIVIVSMSTQYISFSQFSQAIATWDLFNK